MHLFFATSGKVREFEFAGERWREIPFGQHFAALVNAMLRRDTEGLRQMAGLPGGEESEVVSRLWPVAFLGRLLVGNKAAMLDMLPPEEAAPLAYLTGQKQEFWQLWRGIGVYPYCFSHGKGYRIGFQCACNTTLEAAAAEVAFGLALRVKALRFCQRHRTVHHGTCSECQPEEKRRERFLALLRQHKHQLKKGRLKGRVEEAAYLVRQIGRLQEEADKGKSLNSIIAEYASLCRDNGLPTRWAKSFLR